MIQNNYSITDNTIDSFNNERIFTVKGSVENMSKAEAQISARLRQCFENISVRINKTFRFNMIKKNTTSKY